MDEFVIEEYIEISIDIGIVHADPRPHSYSVTIQQEEYNIISQKYSNNWLSIVIGKPCWGWLIEERVDEFVIEKYIEISIGIGIVYADPRPHSYSVMIQQEEDIIRSTFIYF